jgi:hypothetical protein
MQSHQQILMEEFEIMKRRGTTASLLMAVVLTIFIMACGKTYKISGNVTLSGSAMQGVTMTLSGASSVTSTNTQTTTTDVNGHYLFRVNANGLYTVTPSMTGYTFNPSSISVTIDNADSTENNFTAGGAVKTQMGGAIQGILLNLTGAVSTLAGTAGATGYTDGTGTAALFNSPGGVTTDGTSLYVADTDNSTIRQLIISTGVVTTLAGLAENAGWTNGIGTAARFSSPKGITTDGTNLYDTDTGTNTIRQIVIYTGAVTTLAGTAYASGSTDGTGSAARFNSPQGITMDKTNLYIADTSNNTIRQIVISTGAVTTLAGLAGNLGSSDGTGSTARFNSPEGITTDGTNLYVTDTLNNTIRKINISTGAVTTLAGLAGNAGSADGTGSAARFYSPEGITTDGTNLYVTDTLNNTIRQVVVSSGVVTTLAGTVGETGSTDGTGSAALFYNPYGITTDGTSLYVADTRNDTIREIQ